MTDQTVLQEILFEVYPSTISDQGSSASLRGVGEVGNPCHVPLYTEPTSQRRPSWLLPLVFHIYFPSQSTWLRASVQTRIDYLDRLSTEAKEGAFIHSDVRLLDLNDLISDLSVLSLGSGAANSVSVWRV